MKRERSDAAYPGLMALAGGPFLALGFVFERWALVAIGVLMIGLGLLLLLWMLTATEPENDE